MKQQMSLLSIRQKEAKYMLAKSIDNHPEFKTEIMEISNPHDRNIFSDPLSLKLCQYDPSIGPRLENNKILRRSIVGKPDIFRKKLSNLVDNPSSRRSIYKGTTTNAFRNNAQTTQQQNVLTGEELIQKVNLLEKHLFETRLKEDQELMKMPFQRKQIEFKQTRALDEYLTIEKAQNNIIMQSAKKTNRDPTRSVMLDLYRFRRLREYGTMNDSMNQYQNDKTIRVLEVDDDSNHPLFMLSEKDEVIRKPSIANQDETVSSIMRHLNEDPVYNSFSSNSYLKSQQSRYAKLANEYISINTDSLIVQGQSKLDQEIKFDINGKYYMKTIDKGEDDDVIAENYSAYYKINYK